jgi:hypothetical protein
MTAAFWRVWLLSVNCALAIQVRAIGAQVAPKARVRYEVDTGRVVPGELAKVRILPIRSSFLVYELPCPFSNADTTRLIGRFLYQIDRRSTRNGEILLTRASPTQKGSVKDSIVYDSRTFAPIKSLTRLADFSLEIRVSAESIVLSSRGPGATRQVQSIPTQPAFFPGSELLLVPAVLPKLAQYKVLIFPVMTTGSEPDQGLGVINGIITLVGTDLIRLNDRSLHTAIVFDVISDITLRFWVDDRSHDVLMFEREAEAEAESCQWRYMK